MKGGWKHALIVLHRWSGVVVCAFFALWFVSGAFMMYVNFPALTDVERLAGTQPLDFARATLSPGEAAARLRRGDFHVRSDPAHNTEVAVEDAAAPMRNWSRIVAGMVVGRPAYFFYPEGGLQPRTVFADDGEVLASASASLATQSAAGFAVRSGLLSVAQTASLPAPQLVQTDQWSVTSALNVHRPLFRFDLGDVSGTQLYVSTTTGEVIRDTHRSERILNYFAAVTHWLYPTLIRRHVDAWAWMVDVLSGIGCAVAVTGLWLGIWRWRRSRPPGASPIPYRGIMRWHHITGLAFGIVALTWVLSGLLSMNPGGINAGRTATRAERMVLAGKDLDPGDFALAPLLSAGSGSIIDAELIEFRGQPLYALTAVDGGLRMVGARVGNVELPDSDSLVSLVSGLMPATRPTSVEVLDRYDDYYYSRGPETASRSLPVIRARFADAQQTWFYVDVRTGRIVGRYTRFNRVYRWLYGGLHSWDFGWLRDRRPLWDIAMLAFLAGGLALSVFGVVVGWRRVRFTI